jgi:beta-lactamase superfamily II metal-dependent hydrolase
VTEDEWEDFASYREYYRSTGTKLYSPSRQNDWTKPWWVVGGWKIWMLGPTQADVTAATREIHDACLVFKVEGFGRSCLFTGDASDKALSGVATINHIGGDILHASHHGSINGADLSFIKKADPAFTVISTEPGVHDNVPHPTALSRYASHTRGKVYRTDQWGTVTFQF